MLTKESTSVRLEDIAEISSGKRPKEKNDIGKYPLIGASGIMAYCNEFNYDEDIIIIGRVGTLGVVKRYNYPIWASDNTLTIRTNYKNYIENYLSRFDYAALNRGSTQPLITQADIKKQEILFDEKIVKKFENDTKQLRDLINKNNNQNATLDELRDTLLPKLMNGEIDLDKIDI